MQSSSTHNLFERMSLLGDEGALSELHDRYFYRLYKLCYSIIGNKETAEEITNDVFYRHLAKKAPVAEGIESGAIPPQMCTKQGFRAPSETAA